jgi:N-acetyl-anhydromuramyl-L-alanine amidase AmpD
VEGVVSGLERIILHWTAGADGLNEAETDAYHFIVARDGKVYEGQDKPEDNIAPLGAKYAAHTLNCNGGSIGVSLDAMADAKERPFRAGRFPITEAQLDGMAALVARLCVKYGIPVTRRTVLTHAEVQPTLGIPQRQKWDITWLPGMDKPGDAVAVGDVLRARITAAMPKAAPAKPYRPWWHWWLD